MEKIKRPERLAVGVDVGGTHITAAVIDIDTRTVVVNTIVRETVDANAPANDILAVWFSAIANVLGKSNANVARVGFAMPGPFDYDGGISLIKNMHKYEALYGLNIKEMLAVHFNIDKEQIRMRNDTEAFLAGEVMAGAAQGYSKAIGITLGTGLGSAKHIHGVTEDVNLGSSLFKDGIAEDYLSTRWFVKRYRELTGTSIKGVKELLDQHKSGDGCTPQILEEFYVNLAGFLKSFIEAENPQVVIIGGNIAQAYEFFYPPVSKLLSGYAGKVVFKKAALAETAALIGSVSTWMEASIAING
jgi:glucokinase